MTAAIVVWPSIGLGYVGLPLAIVVRRGGPRGRRDRRLGDARRDDPGRAVADRRHLRRAARRRAERRRSGSRPRARHGVAEADAVFVCVPTPINSTKDPDLGPVLAAAGYLREHVRAGQLLVLQSTTYPGTTMGPFREVLEASGLRAGVDFDLAYAPERVNPGDPASAARDGAAPRRRDDPAGGRTARRRCSATSTTRWSSVSSPDAAEMAKLLENVFRNVNIAFVNQLALLCERMGLDVWEVIDAAATKPFGFMRFTPGPGVGGHCIPVDPYYLSWRAREFDFIDRFIELAGDINLAMPRHVVDLVGRGPQRPRAGAQGCEGRGRRRGLQARCPGRPELAGRGGHRRDRRARRRGPLPRPARRLVPGCGRRRCATGTDLERSSAGRTSSSSSRLTRRSTGAALYERADLVVDTVNSSAGMPSRAPGPPTRRRLVRPAAPSRTRAVADRPVTELAQATPSRS